MAQNQPNAAIQFILGPIFPLVLAVVLAVFSLIATNKMTAAFSNGLMTFVWALFVYAFLNWVFRHYDEVLPPVLWGVLFAAGLGLVFRYSPFWTPKAAAPTTGVFFSSRDYPAGKEIAGIKWRPEYAELHVDIINHDTKIAYDELSVVLTPENALVAKVGCLEHSGNSVVSFEPATGARSPGMEMVATDIGYRMTCSHLPANGHVTVIFAMVSKVGVPETEHLSGLDDPRFAIGLNIEQDGRKGVVWFGNDPSANIYFPRPTNELCVKVDGTFTAAQRVQEISERVCPKVINASAESSPP